MKKAIWSFLGLVMTISSIALLAVERSQSNNPHPACPSAVNNVRSYVDLICWLYICLVIFLYLVCAIVHLVRAWKMPRQYLKWKGAING